MSRQVKVYFDANQERRFGCMYASETGAIDAARRDYITEHAIRCATVTLPEGAFWVGDTIAVDLHRGAQQDDDGISTGGRWIEGVIGYADVWMVRVDDSGAVVDVVGAMNELGSDKHLQTMRLIAGLQSYPYRNARLIRERSPLEAGDY